MNTDAREILDSYGGVFINRGCLFVSTTGALLSGYVNCEVVFPYYDAVETLVTELIAPFLWEGVECFACPATGDIVLIEYAANYANRLLIPATAVWADKQSDNSYRIERNGFHRAIEGRRTLILNDRISTGGTTRKLIAEVRRCGGDVMGVATLAGISRLTAESLDVPMLHALCNIDVEAHMPDDLPDEWRSMPIAVDDALGHGSDFKRENPDWPGGFVTLL